MIIPIIQTAIRIEVEAATYYEGDVMAEYESIPTSIILTLNLAAL
jgi:hypothetical protein